MTTFTLRALDPSAIPAFTVIHNGGFRFGVREPAMNWNMSRVVAVSRARTNGAR